MRRVTSGQSAHAVPCRATRPAHIRKPGSRMLVSPAGSPSDRSATVPSVKAGIRGAAHVRPTPTAVLADPAVQRPVRSRDWGSRTKRPLGLKTQGRTRIMRPRAPGVRPASRDDWSRRVGPAPRGAGPTRRTRSSAWRRGGRSARRRSDHAIRRPHCGRRCSDPSIPAAAGLAIRRLRSRGCTNRVPVTD